MPKPSNRSKDIIQILLADDYQLVRRGIRQLLESEEDLHVIAEAGDGEEAFGLFAIPSAQSRKKRV